jgi:glutathione synthase/RimK-type ligase-like ATP-grasp enzyme
VIDIYFKMATALGVHIPRTLITNDPAAARRFFEACSGQAVVKTFRGIVNVDRAGIHTVFTHRLTSQDFDDMHLEAPCLFQEYVPKEVELRITLVGRHVLAVEIDSQRSTGTRDDWRRGDANLSVKPCAMPPDIETAVYACFNTTVSPSAQLT